MGSVRIGFVGAGAMGQMAHLTNYANLDGCEVVALAELRPKLAGRVAEKYGIPKVYRTGEEMLEAEELDGVVASQPFTRHADLLPAVYARVKHVFTEKPLALSVEAGRKLVDAAADAGCVHMVGYHKRSDPATIHAKRIIDEWRASDTLGAMRYVRILMPAGDWIQSGFVGLVTTDEKVPPLEGEPAPPGMDEATAREYASFVNYYIHQVNLMRHLMCEPYRVTYAERSGVLMAVESASGVPGVIEMTPYRTTVDWDESALVAFEKGYVLLRLPAPLAANRPGSVEVFTDRGEGEEPKRTIPSLPWVHAMRQQAVRFVEVCRGEAEPPCDAAEAAADLAAARDYVRLRFGG